MEAVKGARVPKGPKRFRLRSVADPSATKEEPKDSDESKTGLEPIGAGGRGGPESKARLCIRKT